MNLLEKSRRAARGPVGSRVLVGLGIDPKPFWLLMDLFSELSDRGELLSELGRNGVSLQVAANMYAGLTSLIGVFVLVAKATPAVAILLFTGITVLVLLTLLISEAGNSLLNPGEAAVLAHQPVSPRTFLAAKLSHLGRIILYIVPACNLLPAFLGWGLKGASPAHPLLHLLAATIAGLLAGLACCALYGWLLRFVPERRIRAAAQLAGVLPLIATPAGRGVARMVRHSGVQEWIGAHPGWTAVMGSAAVAAAGWAVVFGIRSLSMDYRLRAPAGSTRKRTVRRGRRASFTAGILRRFFGGQGAVAGHAFASKMMLRDWHFRRQAVPFLVAFGFAAVPAAMSGWPPDPFSGALHLVHSLPHATGAVLLVICLLMPYGNDRGGTWLFHAASPGMLHEVARGVHGLLWMDIVVLSHAAVLPVLVWRWGAGHALLFVFYSAALASCYLAVELRLLEALPFSKALDPARGASMMPVLAGAFAGLAAAFALQQFVLFRSVAATAAAAGTLAIVAVMLTRSAVRSFGESMRNELAQDRGETAFLC